MKLKGVIVGASELRYPADAVKLVADSLLMSGTEVLSHGGYRTLRQELPRGFQLGSFKGDELIGWATFSPVELHGTSYQRLDGIYVVPEHRGSMAVGRFIYGIHALDIGPVVLGTGDDEGGFLFAGGAELLRAVLKRPIFKVSVLDTRTGEKVPYGAADERGPGMTLVLEDVLIRAAYHVYAQTTRPVVTANLTTFASTHDLLEGQL